MSKTSWLIVALMVVLAKLMLLSVNATSSVTPSPLVTKIFTQQQKQQQQCVKQRKENHFLKVLVTIIANENFECLSRREQRQVLNSFQRLINESYAEWIEIQEGTFYKLALFLFSQTSFRLNYYFVSTKLYFPIPLCYQTQTHLLLLKWLNFA